MFPVAVVEFEVDTPVIHWFKMPHGDLSDYAAYFCAAAGLGSIFAPSSLWYSSFGPVQPFFKTEATPETLSLIQAVGGLLMFFFPVLFVNRWNTVNGKAGMLGMFIASGTFAKVGLSIDGGEFVLRGWYIFSLAFLIAGLHLGFNANPMWTSETLRKKEEEKAAKKAANKKA